MALLTLGSELATVPPFLVGVILLVARVAVLRVVLVAVIDMALFALCFLVLVEQFEFRLVVIEGGFLPLHVGMAVLAFLAKPAVMAFVVIILLVTGKTVRGNLAVLLSGLVAVFAAVLCVPVPATQPVASAIMIEGFLFDGRDDAATTDMFGVAFAAGLILEVAV